MNFGKFINATPLRCEWLRQESWCVLWKVDIWEYFADTMKPLTYVCPPGIVLGGIHLPEGTQLQPDRHFITDFGSIPPPLMALPSFSRTRFIHSYLSHDSGYKIGGVYILYPQETLFHFMPLSKEDMDNLLLVWCGAEGANYVQRHTIYRAVRVASLWVKYPQSPRSKSVT